MYNEITYDEIMKCACDSDEEGKAKSLIIIGLHKVNINNPLEEPETIMEVSTTDAILEIKTIGMFTIIALKFPNYQHPDLALFYRCAEMYYDKADKVEKGYELAPFISIVPLELQGEYMINAIGPQFWAPEPDIIGEQPRVLRFAFLPESVQYAYVDMDEDDIQDLINNSESNMQNEVYELYGNLVDDTDDEEDERNKSFTDDKYSPENNFGLFDIDEGESDD